MLAIINSFNDVILTGYRTPKKEVKRDQPTSNSLAVIFLVPNSMSPSKYRSLGRHGHSVNACFSEFFQVDND